MFKHLLIPLDGSQLAEAALPVALELASRFNSQVTLFRVIQPPHYPPVVVVSEFTELMTTLREEVRREALTYLQTKQKELEQQGHTVTYKTAEGEQVAELILEAVNELNVDTIVMSTHGWSGFKRWVYGSVADKVLRHAHTPIVLIRAKEEWVEVSLPPIENAEAICSHEEATS